VSDERLTSLRSRLDEYAAAVDIDAKRARIAELEGTMSQQGFWDDQERAHAVIDELKVTKGLVEPYEELERSVAACEELLEMAAGDDEALAELDAEIARLDEAYDALEIKLALSGPHDRSNIYLSIQPGAGGVEACDWAEMMLRMYTNYCQRAGYACDVLDVQPGDEAGIKGCTLYIKGPMAYGYFKSEMGTHRLVRMSQFDSDREEVIRRAHDAAVVAMIVVAIDLESAQTTIELAEHYDGLFAAVGFHPTDCGSASEDDFVRLAQLTDHPKVVAVGEIGLDFYWKTVEPEVQKRAFIRQLHFAKEIAKPVIIHNRDAGAAILQTLKDEGIDELFGVFHCFTEDADYARQVLDLGCHISFTGNLTYKKSSLPEVASIIPLDRLLLETDCPFMSPVPYRGKRNEPALVVETAKKLAAVTQVTFEEVCRRTTQNASRLFGLELSNEKDDRFVAGSTSDHDHKT